MPRCFPNYLNIFLTINAINNMSHGGTSKQRSSSIELELYFLIERFLSTGPCKSAAKVLRRELNEQGLLPNRIDWEGGEHERSFESLLELNRHIGSDHLLKICQRLGPLVDEKIRPNIMGVRSLLGAGTQSLLRTQKDMKKMSWFPQTHLALHHGCSVLPPINLVTPKWQFVQRGMEMTGQTHLKHVIPTCIYSRIQQHSRKLGHLSAVYCALFDRTGQYIFTAADDCLVKIWLLSDSRLKATLRGHAGEITDMSVNYENTLIASGSCDKTIRVWCLKSRATAAVLQGHTGMITSLQFSPLVKGNKRYLASTGADACICFWEWNVTNNKFNPKPVKCVERSRAGAQVLCSSFSPGGMFYAAGSTDNVIRMYDFQATYPEKIGELEKHTDRVDSICYANHDNRFMSGSRDGKACVWRFERTQWRSIVLDMALKLPRREGEIDSEEEDRKKMKQRVLDDDDEDDKEPQKLKVTMVGWNNDDSLVMTAINDRSLKVWCSYTGKLLHRLRGHGEEVFVLEASPIDSRIMMSAGHDGNIIIWDIVGGRQVKRFYNRIEGQGHGAVFDCKFSPDGTSFAATDSHGQMMIYGYGQNDRCNQLPDQLFFHTDYRPLMRDSNNYVLDEQTQQAPHLMPPPFLVDIDGNPYTPHMQRLVPGREKYRDDQLIPEVAVNEEGEQEVMGDRVPEPSEELPVVEQEPDTSPERAPSGEVPPTVRASIDQMIEQLAREQDQQRAARGQQPLGSPPPQNRSPRAGLSRMNSVAGTSGSHMVGMRRDGETEGVRQSLGNILQVSTSKDLVALSRRMVIKGMDPAVLEKSECCRIAHAERELRQYMMETRRKNPVVSRHSSDEPSDIGIQTRKKKKKSKHGYSTRAGTDTDATTNRLTRRALYDTDEEEPEDEPGSDMWDEDVPYVDDSSEYSDWCVDTSSNLQPPKRKSTRIRKRKRYTSTENSEEEDEQSTPRGSREGTPGSPENSQKRGKAPKKQEKQPAKKVKSKRGRKKQTAIAAAKLPGKSPEEIHELLRIFRPPDWLTDVVPRKQPYFPQMGDEVMYFRQGHEFYVKEVVRRKVYPIDANKNQAWHKYPSLREQELVRIVGIRYELLNLCGVRLCCLKLNYINLATLKNSGGSFSIKYHDMPDVVDFLVLKQNYDNAMSRNWKAGDRFRSVIDDSWWIGVIEAQIPYQNEYPDSMFQCFKVRWDNSEKENLSPWDMEIFSDGWLKTRELNPNSMHAKIKEFIADCMTLFDHHPERKTGIVDLYKEVKVKACSALEVKKVIKVDIKRLASPVAYTLDKSGMPREKNGSILITDEERRSFMYKPKPGEWPGGDIEEECDRIIHGWDQVMEHSIAEPFLTPVDMSEFPSYVLSIEYPIDLNTIKGRLEHRFYRRVTALQFDLRYIETNAKKFNEPKSQIVKSAQILCDALLSFIGDNESIDACQMINKLVHGRKIQLSSDSGEEMEDYNISGPSSDKKKSSKKHRLSVHGVNPGGWKVDCQQLLGTIIQCEDSEPFRTHVDINTYEDYYTVIDNPMDLSIVRDNFNKGLYTSPQKFAKDMMLIFTNSKMYNTNKRAKIYTMTLRLSAMFESRMKEIMNTWRKAIHRHSKQDPNHTRRPRYEEASTSAGGANKHRPYQRISRLTHAGTSGITNGTSHSTTDDDTDVDYTSSRRPRNNFTRTRPIRERRTMLLTTGYTDSDLENQDFPEPKPDYTDDDFELRPSKSPKKKSKRKRSITNGASSEDLSLPVYSTRARTGTIKLRTYTNEGIFADEDDDDTETVKKRSVKTKSNSANGSHQGGARSMGREYHSPVQTSENEASDSDTEIESSISPIKHSKRGRGRVKYEPVKDEEESESASEIESSISPIKHSKRGRGRVKYEPVKDEEESESASEMESDAPKPSRKHTAKCGKNRKKRGRPAKKRRIMRVHADSGTERNSGKSKLNSADSGTEELESGLEDHSPVSRLRASQGSRSSRGHASESDSDPPGRLSRCENTSYASRNSYLGSRQGRRTRNQGISSIKYTEDSGNTDSDDAGPVTVSMRGRVRRPTARARAMYD